LGVFVLFKILFCCLYSYAL